MANLPGAVMMQCTPTILENIKLVGIKVRTNNNIEFNDPDKAKISKILTEYFANNFATKIPNRIKPGTTYCVYTEYESDENGNYTYFIGEEVSNFANLLDNFSTLTIPAQNYIKFTLGPGQMPELCIKAWQKIWQMSEKELGGKRSYIADFEIYNNQSLNQRKTIFDIYIGVKS